LHKAAGGELDNDLLSVRDGWSVGVILASAGYPQSSRKGDLIHGIEPASNIFHSGTKKTDEGFVTNGGRVLCCVAHGPTREAAVSAAYAETSKIAFDGMQRRSDIGIANF